MPLYARQTTVICQYRRQTTPQRGSLCGHTSYVKYCSLSLDIRTASTLASWKKPSSKHTFVFTFMQHIIMVSWSISSGHCMAHLQRILHRVVPLHIKHSSVTQYLNPATVNMLPKCQKNWNIQNIAVTGCVSLIQPHAVFFLTTSVAAEFGRHSMPPPASNDTDTCTASHRMRNRPIVPISCMTLR